MKRYLILTFAGLMIIFSAFFVLYGGNTGKEARLSGVFDSSNAVQKSAIESQKIEITPMAVKEILRKR
jgi:hypothetical protein